jgi:ferredoxin
VCYCFDIVDEGNGREGVRARNWDACQFPMFTLHASGHNPRPTQGDRQRQRLYHKFFVYPEKFGEILCTGCGNCARNCPVGLGVLPSIMEIVHAEPVQA